LFSSVKSDTLKVPDFKNLNKPTKIFVNKRIDKPKDSRKLSEAVILEPGAVVVMPGRKGDTK